MKHRHADQMLIVAVLAILSQSASAAEIRAGLAQVDITPPVGGTTTGYAAAQPTDGVHDLISARCLLLESGQTCIAVISCDLCIFNSAWLHKQVLELGVDHLLLMNTHTHAGPNLRQLDFPSPDAPWRKTVEQRVLQAVKRAKRDMFPAFIAAGEGRLQLGYNRLVRRGNHAVTHFENPDRIPYGSVDPSVGVIRITDDQARIRAVVVVYACHPVVLGPKNRKISGDYPGAMREIVEAQIGQEAMCIFVQGAGGDVNPLFLARGEDRDEDFVMVERMGELLANEVLRVITLIADNPGVSEQLLSRSSPIRFSNRWKPKEEITLGVTTLLINRDIAVMTMPGEPFHQFQLDFRSRSEIRHAFLFGYCSDGPYEWPSYLPDVVSAARGGYGASDTTKAEVGTGERLVNRALAQLFSLQGRLKNRPQRHTFE